MVLWTPLAAVSSVGVRARDGSSARWATRKGEDASDAAVASTNTRIGAVSRWMSTAATATIAARRTSVRIITRRRGQRSAKVASRGEVSAPSTRRIDIQIPTASAPPVSYAQTMMAVA
jgi:hypothetical protein